MARNPVSDVRGSDDGFTLVETLISIAVIGVVMTSLTAFFTNSLSINNQQRGKQAATQIVDDAMERVRSLKGSGIPAGRDKQSSDNQWTNPVVGVAPYLTDMTEAYDSTAAAGSGANASLPTSPLPVTVNGVTFYESFYIGRCWQPLLGGNCLHSAFLATDIEFYRVVAAVTWSEKHCPSNGCSLIATTLVSGVAVEPIFNSNAVAAPPAVTSPGPQIGEVGSAAALTVLASGGAAPLIWSATGLPPGLAMSSAGIVTGIPTTAGTYPVVTTATDDFQLFGSAAFTWIINPPPSLTNPGARTTPVGTAVSLPVALTGGTAPYVWTAPALPLGLTINASTGVISGTPTLTGATNVTVTVTDKFLKAATAAFKWTVIPKPTITTVLPSLSATAGTAITPVSMVATGGTPGYTWSATGLPTGLAISAAGVISGTPTTGSRFVTVVTVTDSLGATSSKTVICTIAKPNATYVGVTAPAADRNDPAGSAVSVSLTAAGGSGTYTWTAAGLPPGVSLAGAKLTGIPTTAGIYITTVTAKDTANKVATTMFIWTIA